MISETPLLFEVRSTLEGPLNPGCPLVVRASPDPGEGRHLEQPVKNKNSPSPKLLKVKNSSPQMFRVRVHLNK